MGTSAIFLHTFTRTPRAHYHGETCTYYHQKPTMNMCPSGERERFRNIQYLHAAAGNTWEYRQKGGNIESPRAAACPEIQNTAKATKSELQDRKHHLEIRDVSTSSVLTQNNPKAARPSSLKILLSLLKLVPCFADKPADQRNTLRRSKASQAIVASCHCKPRYLSFRSQNVLIRRVARIVYKTEEKCRFATANQLRLRKW